MMIETQSTPETIFKQACRLAKDAWLDAERTVDDCAAFRRAESATELHAEMLARELSKNQCREIALAWTKSKLSEVSRDCTDLWAAVGASEVKPLYAYSLILSSCVEVLSPTTDERLSPVALKNRLGKIRAAASLLRDLVKDTYLDENPMFYFEHSEVKVIEQTVRESISYANSDPVCAESLIYGALAKALSPSIREPSTNDLVQNKLDESPIDSHSLLAALITSNQLPSMSVLLERMGSNAGSDGVTPSAFGHKPGAKRAMRKAFAKRVWEIGRAPQFFGKPHRLVIVAAVKLLFDEEVAETDLFG